MLPGTNGISAQPSLDGAAPDLGHDALSQYFVADVESEKRDNDKPRRGAIHRREPYLNDSANGKAGRSPASGMLFEPRQPEIEETFSPFADDLAREVQPRGNDVIGQTLSSVENDLSAADVSIR